MRKLLIVSISLFSAALLAGCERPEHALEPAEIGRKAPAFALKDLEGRTVRLSDHEGSVVVIDFWATWCHACKDAVPALERLHNKYGEGGLVVLGITLDSGFRAEENVRAFANKYGMTYTVLWDDKRTGKAYGAIKIPVTYVLGRDHVVAEKYVGFLPGMEVDMEERISALLAE